MSSGIRDAHARRVAPRQVNYEDVDDIIGIASELQELERDRLSVEDLKEVASELDIPERYLQPAIAELGRRRKVAIQFEAEGQKRRRLILWGLSAAGVLLVILAISGHSHLSALAVDAQKARSQWANVEERQVATERLWRSQPDSPEKMAELSGSENRVRIERKRYDEAASAYNEAAASFPASLWRSLFAHPERMPLSDNLPRGAF